MIAIRNTLVLIQMLTMIGLVVLFWQAGNHRAAGAQFLYVIATGVLFLGLK